MTRSRQKPPPTTGGFWSLVVSSVGLTAQFAVAVAVIQIAAVVVMAIPIGLVLMAVWVVTQVLG